MTAKQPISEAYLLHELMDPNVAKFPREHAAVREIERLRAPVETVPMTADELLKAAGKELDELLDHIYEYGTSAEGVLQLVMKYSLAIEAETLRRVKK